MKVLRSFWFSHMGETGTIGIVVGEDELTKERKAYLGTVSGNSEQMDTALILARGSPLSQETLQDILQLLITTDYVPPVEGAASKEEFGAKLKENIRRG